MKNMGPKKRVNELNALKIILKRYVFRIPQIRILIFPVILSIFMGKYFEIKVSDCVSQISESLESEDSTGDKVFVYIIISLLSIVFTELQGFVFVSAVQSVYRYTLKSTFEYFIRMEMEEFDSYGFGTIQSIITRKSKAISEFIEVIVQSLVPVILGFVMVSLSIYSKFGMFVTFTVVVSIALYAFLTIYIALWRNRIRGVLNKAENAASNIVYDSLSNHETVVSFNSYDIELKRYDESLVDIERSGTSLFRGLYVLNMFQRLIFAFLNSFVVMLGVYGILADRMNKDLLIFYFTASRILLSNLSNLGYTYCKFMETMLNAREVLSEDYSVSPRTGLPLVGFRQSIVFNDVHLTCGDKKILNGVSFAIDKGDRVAIIGPNGAGKSSILKALLRFSSYHGSIYIDGVNIQTVENDSFRKTVGYVAQNPMLFNDTVLYNIKYGNTTASEYMIVDFAKKFNIHNSIMRLERGYLTEVGESGKRVSGGERQKIAVLRTLLRRPEILVVDEPTSSLDKEAEYDILNSIMKMSESLTVLAVIHNLDLLPFFNKICLVEGGTATMITDIDNGTPGIMLEKLGLEKA